VRDGRRKEFVRFAAFQDGGASNIADPLAESTFLASKLDWNAADADTLAFYRLLLEFRRAHVAPLLPHIHRGGEAEIVGPQAVRVIWRADGRALVLDANLSGSALSFPPPRGDAFFIQGEADGRLGPWTVRWSVE
jgi:maltooligosyltrehalose trehalohydrolase